MADGLEENVCKELCTHNHAFSKKQQLDTFFIRSVTGPRTDMWYIPLKFHGPSSAAWYWDTGMLQQKSPHKLDPRYSPRILLLLHRGHQTILYLGAKGPFAAGHQWPEASYFRFRGQGERHTHTITPIFLRPHHAYHPVVTPPRLRQVRKYTSLLQRFLSLINYALRQQLDKLSAAR